MLLHTTELKNESDSRLFLITSYRELRFHLDLLSCCKHFDESNGKNIGTSNGPLKRANNGSSNSSQLLFTGVRCVILRNV